jgi:hypothetical protein
MATLASLYVRRWVHDHLYIMDEAFVSGFSHTDVA